MFIINYDILFTVIAKFITAFEVHWKCTGNRTLIVIIFVLLTPTHSQLMPSNLSKTNTIVQHDFHRLDENSHEGYRNSSIIIIHTKALRSQTSPPVLKNIDQLSNVTIKNDTSSHFDTFQQEQNDQTFLPAVAR